MPVKEEKMSLISKERTKVWVQGLGNQKSPSRSPHVPFVARAPSSPQRPPARRRGRHLFQTRRLGPAPSRVSLPLSAPSKHPLTAPSAPTQSLSHRLSFLLPTPAVGTRACFSGPPLPSSRRTKHRAGHSRAPARCVDFGIFSAEGEKVQMT